MEYKISYFKSIADKSPSEIPVKNLLDAIKTGKYKEKIEKLRNETDQLKKEQIKKGLPAVTISGIFSKGHKNENLVSHSGLIQIDLDKVTNISETKQKLISDKYSFAVFISPSGNGLKLIVKIRPGISLHTVQFKELEKYYFKYYNLKIDGQCKNLNRLMYVSYDETLYYNPNSLQWEINYLDLFELAIKYIDRYEKFNEGNRNTYVFKLASNCRNKEIPIEYSLSEIIKRFQSETFSEKEIYTTVKSAYKNSNNDESKKETIETPEKEVKTKNEEINTSKFYVVQTYLTQNFDFRYNVISNEIEVKDKDKEQFEALNENELYTHLKLRSINISMNDLLAILKSKFVQHFNPFKDYFNSLSKWDGITDHISSLCSFITAKEQERFNNHFKKALVRCINCSVGMGFNKHAFILIGGQSSGKTTFIRWLCPPTLKNYITENITIDKDGLISLSENLIINLDELAGLPKQDVNALKSILSKISVKVRRPYDRKQSLTKRIANFFGSTNKDEFLTDETGSVRWLCFEILKIDWKYKEAVDIDNIWSHAYSLFLDGFKCELTAQEIEDNEYANSNYQQRSAEMELIQKYFEPVKKNDPSAKAYTSTDILEILKKQSNVLNNPNVQQIGKALTYLEFEHTSERIEQYKNPRKVYWAKFLG